MSALIRLLFHICLFRNGPEDMPYEPRLLGALLFSWLAVQVFGSAMQLGLSLAQMLAVQLLSMLVLMAGTGLVLTFKNLRGRFLQTAMALVGVDLVISVLALPLLIISYMVGAHLPFLDGVYLVLIGWQLAVQSFVFHRALRVSPFLGLGLAIGFMVLTLLLVSNWMPGILTAAGG